MSSALKNVPWVVLKFGGTSVSTAARWNTIADIVQRRIEDGYRVLIVSSALSQVSNRLENLLGRARRGEAYEAELESLRRHHIRLSVALGVTLSGGERYLEDATKLLEGVRLTHEVTPRLHARVLSTGELLSTRIGTSFLKSLGIDASWLDARECLEAEPVTEDRGDRPYLSASCDVSPSPELIDRLERLGHAVFVTQGFIASRNGETVLLGRGGSDTSGAYFAGMLEAERVEIWTDVPGMFSANPHSVSNAILLPRLPYRVAEELALRGAKVLHPAAIRAAERAAVPIRVCWTDQPKVDGTLITDVDPGPPSVKAVVMRKGMVAVSMRVDSDWQPIGLIADLTAAFKKHGLSIDLLASSPTNLTATLDLAANHRKREDLDPLLADLAHLCKPRLIEATASISIVGTGMRALLHEWGEALKCFEDQDVFLVSQAANDRSVSFLVREDMADDLVRRLHTSIFESAPREAAGVEWQDLVRTLKLA